MENKKLTKLDKVPKKKMVLTKQNKANFQIFFGECIEKGYDFKKMNGNHQFKKDLMNFMCRYVNQPITRLEKVTRARDKNDMYQGYPIEHYKVGKQGRLHGYFNKGIFYVLRLDHSHDFHNK